MNELPLWHSEAIFMVKPCGIDKFVGGHNLTILLEGIFTSASLNIRRKSRVALDESEIKEIYPILYVPDPIYGDNWKFEVIDHLRKKPMLAYLLEGKNAPQKTQIIKRHIRRCLIRDNSTRSRIVENFVHVPDEEEFGTAERILFRDI